VPDSPPPHSESHSWGDLPRPPRSPRCVRGKAQCLNKKRWPSCFCVRTRGPPRPLPPPRRFPPRRAASCRAICRSILSFFSPHQSQRLRIGTFFPVSHLSLSSRAAAVRSAKGHGALINFTRRSHLPPMRLDLLFFTQPRPGRRSP